MPRSTLASTRSRRGRKPDSAQCKQSGCLVVRRNIGGPADYGRIGSDARRALDRIAAEYIQSLEVPGGWDDYYRVPLHGERTLIWLERWRDAHLPFAACYWGSGKEFPSAGNGEIAAKSKSAAIRRGKYRELVSDGTICFWDVVAKVFGVQDTNPAGLLAELTAIPMDSVLDANPDYPKKPNPAQELLARLATLVALRLVDGTDYEVWQERQRRLMDIVFERSESPPLYVHQDLLSPAASYAGMTKKSKPSGGNGKSYDHCPPQPCVEAGTSLIVPPISAKPIRVGYGPKIAPISMASIQSGVAMLLEHRFCRSASAREQVDTDCFRMADWSCGGGI